MKHCKGDVNNSTGSPVEAGREKTDSMMEACFCMAQKTQSSWSAPSLWWCAGRATPKKKQIYKENKILKKIFLFIIETQPNTSFSYI